MESLLGVVLALLFHYIEGYCKLPEDENIFNLGTKTPYRLVANHEDEIVSYSGCKPTKIIGIVRHGTRTPGHKNVVKMRAVLSNLKDDFTINDYHFNPNGLCTETKSLLKNWTLFMDTDENKFLTKEGEREMYSLAKRLQRRFPSLLGTYKNESFLFKFTNTQRTKESAKYFAFGLFGKDNNKVWFPEPDEPDPILRFYKLCPKWRTEVKKSPLSSAERKKFSQSDTMRRVLSAVSDRLGLDYTLSFNSVQVMYSTCSFETAWFPNRSPWCNVFQKSDIKVLEYAEELKYYWRDGYGFDINYKQSCPLFENILNFLQGKWDDSRNAVFYFTHSGTILKSLSRLSLYRDPFILTADLGSEMREERLWKVSYIDTFGTNILFILFKCDDGIDKVLVSHQERQVHIEGCPLPPSLCPLSEVSKALSSGEGCQFQQICSLQQP